MTRLRDLVDRLLDRPALHILRAAPKVGGRLLIVAGCLMTVQAAVPVVLIVFTGRMVGSIPAVARDGLGSAAGARLTQALVAMAVLIVTRVRQ